MESPIIGIKILTYKRPSGTTKPDLTRTLKSVLDQEYKNWIVYLVGDFYEDHEEFTELASLIPSDKIKSFNRTEGYCERFHYSGRDLWRCAGMTSANMVMDIIQADGIEICATLDDDDYWHPNHLQVIADAYNNFPEASVVFTRGNHDKMGALPRFHNPNEKVSYNNYPPTNSDTIHAATSWNLQKIPLRYRNTVGEWCAQPGDADLWDRMRPYVIEHGLKYVYVPIITVDHVEHCPPENQ